MERNEENKIKTIDYIGKREKLHLKIIASLFLTIEEHGGCDVIENVYKEFLYIYSIVKT